MANETYIYVRKEFYGKSIRVHGCWTDSDPKYLRAMRLSLSVSLESNCKRL
jgi:hypothetical protein